MTNFEKFKDEILDLAKNSEYLSVVKGQPENCIDTDCKMCGISILKGAADCNGKRILWLYEEYHEPIKLTKKQWNLLNVFETGWLARDKKANALYWYSKKPKRHSNCFVLTPNSKMVLLHNVFDVFGFITWEDEPYSVETMLTWEVEDD